MKKESSNESSEAADKDSKYVGISRLLGYSCYETGKYDKAEQLLTNFFSNHDTLKILAEDYIYLGKIQDKLGSDSMSMAKYDSMSRSSYLMAFQMDSTKEGVIKEIADSLYNQRDMMKRDSSISPELNLPTLQLIILCSKSRLSWRKLCQRNGSGTRNNQ
ncbi:MAG: hypothetical protein IPP89_12935 [Saprospiraceae bacterium]|nr:hypothetical protein [Candidatus Brachybacter algidus]MBL0119853.1 hypothetical protein [Candidatus Brachybacter algidus]